MVELMFSMVGVFRKEGRWVLAFGESAGRDAMSARVESRMSDRALRTIHSAIEETIEKLKENPPQRVDVPLLQPTIWLTWPSLLELYRQVDNRVKQLDANKEIPDSEVFETGGLN